MVSRPPPTAEPAGVVHRVALRPGDPRAGDRIGRAARAAQRTTSLHGVGLTAHLDEAGPGGVPPGLWPAAADEVALDPIVAANPALAAYAAQLRAKRGDDRAAPVRGLPLTVRRNRSAVGPDALPGALARRAVPTDAPQDPDVVAAVRGRRPAGPAASDGGRPR